MKKIIFTLSTVALLVTGGSANVHAQIVNPTFGNCKVLFPGERSAEGGYCVRDYIITYLGRDFDDTCYRSKWQATWIMNHSKVCQMTEPLLFGNCEIKQNVKEGKCSRGDFTYTLKGHDSSIIGGCISGVQSTYSAMKANRECIQVKRTEGGF